MAAKKRKMTAAHKKKLMAGLKRYRAGLKKKAPAKRKPVKRKAIAKKKPVKRRANPVKKRVAKKRAPAKNYLVKLKWGNKTAYYSGKTFYTTVDDATRLTKAGAERKATELFNKHKHKPQLKWVKVVKK